MPQIPCSSVLRRSACPTHDTRSSASRGQTIRWKRRESPNMNRPIRTKLSERGQGLGRLPATAAAALKLPLPGASRRTEPFLAHACDIDAPTGRLCACYARTRIICAQRAYFAESDASENRTEVCSDLWSIFRVREFPSAASVRATQVLVRQKEAARMTGQVSARGLKNYAHKRI